MPRLRADFIPIGAREEIGRRRISSAVWLRLDSMRSPARSKRFALPAVEGDCPATESAARLEHSLLAAYSIASHPWEAGTEVRILNVVEPRTSLFHVRFPSGAEEALRAQASRGRGDSNESWIGGRRNRFRFC